jgi:hypothetical protein
MDLFNNDDFAQCWVKDHINFPNPPFEHFNLTAHSLEERLLHPSQQYAIAWMDQRVEAGGGIIADTVGLGKVLSPPLVMRLIATMWVVGRMAMYLLMMMEPYPCVDCSNIDLARPSKAKIGSQTGRCSGNCVYELITIPF